MTSYPINFCLRCGTRLIHRYRVGRRRPVCPNCDWVYFPDPKVAAAVLVQREGQVLLARRVNQPQKGLWTLPVGFVDAGENPAEAARRECLEETGLQVQITGLLDVLSFQEHPRGADILIVYHAKILSGDLQPGDDADQVDFFSVDQLPPLAFESTLKILQAIG